jgi:hypothetical protein
VRRSAIASHSTPVPTVLTVSSSCWRQLRRGSNAWTMFAPPLNDRPLCRDWNESRVKYAYAVSVSSGDHDASNVQLSALRARRPSSLSS